MATTKRRKLPKFEGSAPAGRLPGSTPRATPAIPAVPGVSRATPAIPAAPQAPRTEPAMQRLPNSGRPENPGAQGRANAAAKKAAADARKLLRQKT